MGCNFFSAKQTGETDWMEKAFRIMVDSHALPVGATIIFLLETKDRTALHAVLKVRLT